MTEPLRVILDSNAYDALHDDPAAAEAVRSRIDRGELEVSTTHIQDDENADGLTGGKGLGSIIDTTFTPTCGLVLDVSRVGMARLGSEDDSEVLERLRSGRVDRSKDALIGVTAIRDGLILVSGDRTLRRDVVAEGGQAWTNEAFLEWALAVDPDAPG